MPVRLKFDQNKVAIYNDENEAAFTTPLEHLDDVFLHSDLNYLHIIEERTITVTLPARDSGDDPWWQGGSANDQWYYTTTDLFAATSPFLFAMGRYNKSSLNGSLFVDLAGDTYRSISLVTSGSTIQLLETSRVRGYLPQKTIEISVFLLNVATAIPGEPGVEILSDGFFSASHGKLSTDRKYLRRANTVPEDFFIYANEPSIDLLLGGMRFIDGDGQVFDMNGYSGTFVNPSRIGVLG